MKPKSVIAEPLAVKPASITIPTPLKPIDTSTKVMTDLPKSDTRNIATKISDSANKLYDEMVNKNSVFSAIEKRTGVQTGVRASNINRMSGRVDYQIGKAQTNIDGDDIGKSIESILTEAKGIPKKDAFDYVYNRHAIDRYREGKPVFGESVTPEVSMAKMAELEKKYPTIKQFADDVVTYHKNLLEVAVDSGLTSRETADLLKKTYGNYVPTARLVDIPVFMGSGDGNYVAQVIKKAKGSELDILPLDQQMAFATNKIFRAAEKNKLMNEMAVAFDTNPSAVSKYIKDVKPIGGKAEKVNDLLEVGQSLEKSVEKSGTDYLVTFYKEGKPHQMRIDKRVYDAITEYDSTFADEILNSIKKYATKPFKAMITQYNPTFPIANIARDIPTALLYSNDPIKLLKSTPEAVRQMMQNGADWRKYQALGGTRSGLFNYEKGVRIPFGGEKSTAEKAAKGLKEGAKTMLGGLGEVTETVPRFAEYLANIKAGKTPAESLAASAELTVDFARHGKTGKKADAVIPYFNAGLQGLDRFARQVAKKPLQTAIRGGLLITTPTVLLDIAHKNDEEYNNMSARERNSNYHIRFGDKFVRVPKSRETGVIFSSVYDWLARSARGQKVTPEEMGQTIAENFTPSGLDSNIFNPAIKFWNIVSGKDEDTKNFFGSQIVPESLQKYSPGMQYDDMTSLIAKNLGAYLDVSPKAIDYLIDSYTGFVGDVISDPTKPAIRGNLLSNRFIADPVYKSDSTNKFYDEYKKLQTAASDYNRKFNIPSEDKTPIEKRVSEFRKATVKMSELREEERAALKQKDADKARQIKIEMNALADAIMKSKPSNAFERAIKELKAK